MANYRERWSYAHSASRHMTFHIYSCPSFDHFDFHMVSF